MTATMTHAGENILNTLTANAVMARMGAVRAWVRVLQADGGGLADDPEGVQHAERLQGLHEGAAEALADALDKAGELRETRAFRRAAEVSAEVSRRDVQVEASDIVGGRDRRSAADATTTPMPDADQRDYQQALVEEHRRRL